jgi:hypothetical protein
MDLGEIRVRWGCVKWISLVQDTGLWRVFLKTVMKFLSSVKGCKLLSGCTNIGLSSRA